jgi:hypothetical protein
MPAASPAPDVTAAEWVVNGLRGFAESVLSLVPEGLPSYVRVFHPAYRNEGASLAPVRWSEVAAANGAVAHPAMQLGALTGNADEHATQPGVFDSEPEVGCLPEEVREPLVAALRPHTTTPDRCWFAVW